MLHPIYIVNKKNEYASNRLYFSQDFLKLILKQYGNQSDISSVTVALILTNEIYEF